MEHIPIVYLWVDGDDENYRKKYCIKKSSRNRAKDPEINKRLALLNRFKI